MKKFFGNFFSWKKLILFLTCVCLIGFIGRLVPYGDEMWNFLFENMIWFPVEAGVTIFIVDKIIKKNNDEIENIREFNQYYSLAGEDLEEMIAIFKVQLISGVTNTQFNNEEIDSKFRDIFTNLDNYVSVEKMREGFNAPILDLSDPMKSLFNPRFQRKSFFQSLPEAGEIIQTRLYSHFSVFLKYIPVDLFRELNSIRQSLENHIYFSENDNLKIGRNMLLERENSKLMSDDEYQQAVNLVKEFYQDIFEKISSIEKILIDNKTETN